MRIEGLPFGVTKWSQIEPTHHPGAQGSATWRTCQFGPIRVRMVEYSPGYLADHWCEKGHVVLCLEGELRTETQDGGGVLLSPGMSYQVGDGTGPHRSSTQAGAVLFIVD